MACAVCPDLPAPRPHQPPPPPPRAAAPALRPAPHDRWGTCRPPPPRPPPSTPCPPPSPRARPPQRGQRQRQQHRPAEPPEPEQQRQPRQPRPQQLRRRQQRPWRPHAPAALAGSAACPAARAGRHRQPHARCPGPAGAGGWARLVESHSNSSTSTTLRIPHTHLTPPSPPPTHKHTHREAQRHLIRQQRVELVAGAALVPRRAQPHAHGALRQLVHRVQLGTLGSAQRTRLCVCVGGGYTEKFDWCARGSGSSWVPGRGVCRAVTGARPSPPPLETSNHLQVHATRQSQQLQVRARSRSQQRALGCAGRGGGRGQ